MNVYVYGDSYDAFAVIVVANSKEEAEVLLVEELEKDKCGGRSNYDLWEVFLKKPSVEILINGTTYP